jgi:hypothetical protein
MFVFLRRKITVFIFQNKMEGKRGRSPSSTPSTNQNKFRRHSHETTSDAAPPSDEVRIIYGNAPDRDKRTGGHQKRESPLSSARQPHNRRDSSPSPSSRPAKSETRQGAASDSRHSQTAFGSSGRVSNNDGGGEQRNEARPGTTTFNSPVTSRRSCSDDVMSGSVEELRRYIRSMEQERKVLEADVEAGRLKAQCHKCSWLAVPVLNEKIKSLILFGCL